jgi:vancomycin resistance protein YoaR
LTKADDSPAPPAKPPPRWTRWLAPAALGGVLLVGGGAFLADRALHAGRVLRGVESLGVPLGGLTESEARAALSERIAALSTTPLPVRIEAAELAVNPEELGFTIELDGTVAAALAEGRTGGPLDALRATWRGLWGAFPVTAMLRVDPAKVAVVATGWESQAISDGPFEGRVKVEGGEVRPDYPRPGRGVDRAKLAEVALSALTTLPRLPLSVPLAEAQPKRPRADVDRAVERARALTGRPLTLLFPEAARGDKPASATAKEKKKRRGPPPERLTLSDDGSRLVPLPAEPPPPEAPPEPLPLSLTWTRDELVLALESDPSPAEDGAPRVGWNEAALFAKVAPYRDRLETPALPAGFLLDQGKLSVIAARIGVRLEPAALVRALEEAARAPSGTAPLPALPADPPAFTTEDAKELRLSALVSEFTSYHACCQPRVDNIHRIADLLDGRIVRPGETFSVNAVVGPRTAAAGFVAAPTIEEGEMVDSLGGGVSQFATTMFNAIFLAGYDVIERQPHSYYFSRYPHGKDATLSFPKPDLAFRNDTEAAVLIDTSYTGTSITVRFYGDTGGRKVQGKVSSRREITAPPTQFFANKKLEVDEDHVKDAGMVGWSVWVTRTIEYADGTHKEERRKVTYKPRPRKVQVHPCKVPKGHEGYTGEPCPKEEPPEDDADAGTMDEETAPPEEVVGE